MSRDGGSERLRLRLFVADGAPNSRTALRNLREILRERGLEDDILEIVDVFQDPDSALTHGIIVTPTLLRLAPGPHTRIVGTLSETDTVADALSLDEGGSVAEHASE